MMNDLDDPASTKQIIENAPCSISLQSRCFIDSFLTVYWFAMVFFFEDTATTEIYTLSLHDALPILRLRCQRSAAHAKSTSPLTIVGTRGARSEEHTSELQSPCNLVCRLLLEKK